MKQISEKILVKVNTKNRIQSSIIKMFSGKDLVIFSGGSFWTNQTSEDSDQDPAQSGQCDQDASLRSHDTNLVCVFTYLEKQTQDNLSLNIIISSIF